MSNWFVVINQCLGQAYRKLSYLVGMMLFAVSSNAMAADCDTSGLAHGPNHPNGFYGCYWECFGGVPGNLGSCPAPGISNFCERFCAGADECPKGNPIDITTGTKHETVVDYRGGGHYPLEVRRYYSSSKFDISGNFGQGWSSVETSTIYSNIYNNFGQTVEQYTVRRSNGTEIRFGWGSGAGDTVPHKAKTKETLTLFNYQDAQIWELKLADGSKELYYMDLVEFSANESFTSRLMWRENPQGFQHIFAYDDQGRVETVTDSYGKQLVYTYYDDGTNRIQSITAPGNRVFKYEYDSFGNLEYAIYPDETAANDSDNPRVQYHYEDTQLDVNDKDNDGDTTERLYPNHLTGITDETGNRYATFTYDNRGRAITSEHAGGTDKMEILSFSPIKIRNALGKETTYNFSTIGSDEGTMTRLVGVEGHPSPNCLGYNSSITYDTNGQKDLVTDFEGNVTDYDIDTEGFEIQRIEASNHPEPVRRTITSTWDKSLFRPDTITVAGHKVTDYNYANRRIDLITETDLLTTGNPTREWDYSYTYHGTGQLNVETITVDGPRTDVTDTTVKTYNSQGLLIETTNALGQTTQFQDHNAEGLPQTMVDANGVVTELEYTTRGWLNTVIVKSALGDAVTDYDYYPNGLVQTITQPNGVQLSYQYDAAKRLTRITNSLNEYIEYELNALGNREVETIFSGSGGLVRQHNFAFDELGRLLKKFGLNDQELESFTYDGNGNVTHIADNNLLDIVQGFDGLDRLQQVTDREGGVTVYTYDDLDQMDTVTDANSNVTDYDYNGFGFLTRLSSPDTGVTNYTSYDLAGNLLSKTDAREVVTNYTYDALNRVTSVSFPSDSSKNITYVYDETQTKGFANAGIGRLTRVVEANGTETAWIYNDLGHIVRDIRVIGGETYTVRYQYDLAGVLTHIFYPSGRELEFIQNPNGQAQTVRTRKTASGNWIELADNITYKPFGPISEFVYGNGLAFTRTYDLHYRPELISTGDGSTDLMALDYGFNDNNELNEILDLVEPANDKSFIYDGNMRLTDASGAYGAMNYGYDPVGNRELHSTTASPLSENFIESYVISPVSNRLQSISATGSGGQSASFIYDDVGNITNDGQYGYDYDARGRLAAVTQGSATVASYAYNAFAERVTKTVGSSTTHFIYDLQNRLVAEADASGEIKKEYIYLGDQLLSIVEVEAEPVEPSADLSVSLSHTRNGNIVDYEITVQNLGPDTASGVILNNTNPANVEIDSFSVTAGSCSQSGQNIDCQLGDMASGSSNLLSVTIIAEADVDIAQVVTASVSSSTADPNLGNNAIQQAGSGCFIATAAYGSYEHQYLHVLRDFRDDYLLPTEAGKAFVDYYYATSPELVNVMNEHDWMKPLVRMLLLPLIALAALLQAPLLVKMIVVVSVLSAAVAYKKYGVAKLIKKSLMGAAVALGFASASASADEIYYIHSDHLNTPEMVTDADRSVVWKSNRTPFGVESPEIATIEQPFRFPGQYYDAETGLYYNLNRYYHPGLGRYITSDPIGLGGGVNTYGYAGQNPAMAYDPTGEFFFLAFAPWLGLTTTTAFAFDAAFALSLLAAINNANIQLSDWDEGWDGWDDDTYSDPYGGYDQGDEDDALNLGENLTGEESCALLSEAITALKNRIKGREQNCEDNDGGDPGHWQRIDRLKNALKNLEAAMTNCK